jgi:hypothetical protein
MRLAMLRLLASLTLAVVGPLAAAQERDADARNYVQFVQDFGAMCVSRNAVEILIKSSHPSRTVRVWLDRYNAGVGTGDRSRTDLKPGAEPEPLGCSRTLEGATQEWRVVRAQFSD